MKMNIHFLIMTHLILFGDKRILSSSLDVVQEKLSFMKRNYPKIDYKIFELKEI